MAKRRMNKLRLLAELRKLLSRPDTTIVQRKLRICGESEWEYAGDEPVNIKIMLDPRRDGRIRVVLHELLHVYMATHLNIDSRMVYELEEAAILAWENKLYDYLHAAKNAKALESWDRAIIRKAGRA